MKLFGLQKLTLLDYPGHTACTVFTGGCNFRCPFCHNAPLVTKIDADTFMEEDVFLSFLRKRKGILDGVCITGGEPLLQPDIAAFIRKIKTEGFLVKLDTNGSFPEKLREILDEGLADYVAMDIKNTFSKYAMTAGTEVDIQKIGESMDLLLSGSADYEFRTTVVRELHTEADISEIAQRIAGARRYFLQNFVHSENLIAENFSAHAPETLEKMKKLAQDFVPETKIRGI